MTTLWRNRDYLGWWTATTVSAVGTSVSAIAFPLLVLYGTGSAALAGTLTAAGLAGTLVATLPGGALADRVSRKAMLVLGPLVQAAALAVVALCVSAGRAPIPLLAGCALVSGLASGVSAGATTPALRRVVPREQLPDATAREMGRDAAAALVGGPLGGVLFSLAHAVPFAADAVSFVFAALGGALIRTPLGPDGDAARRSVLADVRDGLRVVRRTPFLRFVVVWASLLNVAGEAVVLLFVTLVRFRGGSPATVGLVSSLALLGGVAGAVLAPALLARMTPRSLMYAAGWTFSGALAVVAVVPGPWEIGAVLLVAMLAMVPLNVVLESYVVRLVPDAYSGRVSAVNRFGGQALQWAGPLAAGLLADALGAPAAMLVVAGATVPLALALHVTRSLGVLDTPAASVAEIEVGAAAG